MKVRTLRWKINLDYPGGPSLITRVLKTREPFPAVVREIRDDGRGVREI